MADFVECVDIRPLPLQSALKTMQKFQIPLKQYQLTLSDGFKQITQDKK